MTNRLVTIFFILFTISNCESCDLEKDEEYSHQKRFDDPINPPQSPTYLNQPIEPVELPIKKEDDVIDKFEKFINQYAHDPQNIIKHCIISSHNFTEEEKIQLIKLAQEKCHLNTLDIRDSDDFCPLHLAAKQNFSKVAQFLLDNGVTIDISSDTQYDNNFTPLYYALESGHASMAKLLLDYNASINAQDISGNTLLHWAAIWGRVDIVKLFLQKKDTFNCELNKSGYTPLNLAVSHLYCDHSNEKQQIEIAKSLIEAFPKWININGGREGYYPLHNAIDHNSLNMAQLLVENGAKLDVKDNKGLTPLNFAEKKRNDTIKEFLQTWINEKR